MTTNQTAPAALSIPHLRTDLKGRVIAPDDADYDRARTVVTGGIDRRPAVIVKVADATTWSHVVALARETGLELAVRSGGHSGAGHSVDRRRDRPRPARHEGPRHRRRRADGLGRDRPDRRRGTRRPLAEHGLAIGFGDTGSVGIGGITLGGGVGYLVRKHGLTIDTLLAAEVVTADGELPRGRRRAPSGPVLGDPRRRRQLRRRDPLPVPAPRGARDVVGGMLILPATAETVAGFIAAAEAAPEELSTIANVMPCPPMPFVPEEHHGKLVIFGLMTYAGDPAAGERALAPFRALADAARRHGHGPMPYRRCTRPRTPTTTRWPWPARCSSTASTRDVGRRRSWSYLEASDAPMRVAQLRVLGGAMARVPADATAFAHRSSRIMVNVAAFYEGPEDKPMREAWVAELRGRARPGRHAAPTSTSWATRARSASAPPIRARPGTGWRRSRRRYDPDNLFRLNQNIPPAAS